MPDPHVLRVMPDGATVVPEAPTRGAFRRLRVDAAVPLIAPGLPVGRALASAGADR